MSGSKSVATVTRVAAGLAVAVLVGAATAGLAGRPAVAQDAEGESSRVEAGEAIATDRAVVGDGHVDIGPRFLDGEWTLLVRDDTVVPSVWRRLPDVVLQATDTAILEVPDDPQFAFLGQPGDQVWVLPQVQQPGILWPGWNTQDPEVATSVDGGVTWTLHGVEGPGEVVLFVNEDFGSPSTLFDSREAYPQDTGIEGNTHAHANWVFTAPGTYRLAMEMSATTEDGEAVRGGGTLRVAVGDATNPEDAFAAPDLPLPTGDRRDGAETGGDGPAGGTGGTGGAAGSDRDPDAGTSDDRASGATGEGDGSGSAAVWLVAGAIAVLLVGAATTTHAARVRRRCHTDPPGDDGPARSAGRAGAAGGTGAAERPAGSGSDGP